MGERVLSKGHYYVTFDLPIVPEHVHNDSPVCPHCDSKEDSVVIDYPATQTVTTTLLECVDCTQMFLLIETPILKNVKQPVMTRWTVEDGKPLN